MTSAVWIVGVSAPSMALRYAAAFFLVAVGIGLIYALVRLGGALGRAEHLLADVDTEVVPLLKQATETLDGVNTELDKIDVVMTSVVDATEKVDQTTRAVESAISVPAKKAAAFGAGISQAVSTFFNRGADGEPADEESPWDGEASAAAQPGAGSDVSQASWSPPPAEPAGAAPETPAGQGWAGGPQPAPPSEESRP